VEPHRIERLTNKILELKGKISCKLCGRGVLRATDVAAGKLLASCTTHDCKAFREYYLPRLTRKVVYLDTSVVSNMGRGMRPRFRELYDALVRATFKNVVGCVVSTIAVAEIELSSHEQIILAVARRLGNLDTQHEVHVQNAQIYRAFARFRRKEISHRELRPPREDAFDKDVQAWHGMLSFQSRFPPSALEIQRRREIKKHSVEALRHFYAKYAEANLSFDEIAARETTGYCQRAASDAYLNHVLAYVLERDEGLTHEHAIQEVHEFFASEHARLMPAAVINGRLHAALAVASRTEKPRPLDEGDAYDIEHLSTFLPYVDLFVTDADMAAIANRGDVDLTRDYKAAVLPLGERHIPQFLEWLAEQERNPLAELSSAVYETIDAGGYVEDFLARVSR
jgi:hypothetical protein